MHRRFVAALVCASLSMLVQACSDAASETQPRSAHADFVEAADALAGKLGAPGEKAQMPASSDPAVQTFEAQAAKALTALGTEALPVSGFESYEELCGKTANIIGAYAMAGTSGTEGPAQAQKMEQNVARHLDQMFTPLLFAAHCNALHVPFLEGEVDDPAGKADALKQVRDGMLAQVIGLIQMASDATLAADRRRKIVDLLAADAPNFAIALTKDQRRQVTSAAQRAQGALADEAKPRIEQLNKALEAAECGKICSVA